MITLKMALILDEIWRTRNQAVHKGGMVDVHEAIKHIHKSMAEFQAVKTLSSISAGIAHDQPLLVSNDTRQPNLPLASGNPHSRDG